MVLNVSAPMTLGADADSNPRSPRNRSHVEAMVFDEESIAAEIESILAERNPHCHRQIARATTHIVRRKRRSHGRSAALQGARATPAHDADALERIERTDEHRRRSVFGFRHRVHQAVDAVVEIDIGVARRTVERLVASRPARRRVASRIGLTDVGLDLDDRSARHYATTPMHQHFAEEIARHIECRPSVERPWKRRECPIAGAYAKAEGFRYTGPCRQPLQDRGAEAARRRAMARLAARATWWPLQSVPLYDLNLFYIAHCRKPVA